jgi:hypothetical protein
MGSSHFMYIQTFFYNTKSTTANRMQYAMPYKQEGSMYHRYYFNGAWGEWRRHLNADETIAIGTNAQMIRNRIELPYTGIACSYTGGTSSLSIGTTATTVPMTAKNVNTNDVFTLSGGGIVCPYDGTIAISAGVYITPGSSCMAGCYIYKNTTESVSDMRYLTGQFGASIGTRIMNVVAGDVIYLKARSMVNSTAQPNNKATHLSIAYIR